MLEFPKYVTGYDKLSTNQMSEELTQLWPGQLTETQLFNPNVTTKLAGDDIYHSIPTNSTGYRSLQGRLM